MKTFLIFHLKNLSKKSESLCQRDHAVFLTESSVMIDVVEFVLILLINVLGFALLRFNAVNQFLAESLHWVNSNM